MQWRRTGCHHPPSRPPHCYPHNRFAHVLTNNVAGRCPPTRRSERRQGDTDDGGLFSIIFATVCWDAGSRKSRRYKHPTAAANQPTTGFTTARPPCWPLMAGPSQHLSICNAVPAQDRTPITCHASSHTVIIHTLRCIDPETIDAPRAANLGKATLANRLPRRRRGYLTDASVPSRAKRPAASSAPGFRGAAQIAERETVNRSRP